MTTRSWSELKTFRKNHPAENYMQYDSSFKKQFSHLGKKFLKDCSTEMGLDCVKITYNPAGPACPGECMLYGMKADRGICIVVSVDGTVDHLGIMYRTIDGMNDHTGGSNHWMPWNEADPVETFSSLLR